MLCFKKLNLTSKRKLRLLLRGVVSRKNKSPMNPAQSKVFWLAFPRLSKPIAFCGALANHLFPFLIAYANSHKNPLQKLFSNVSTPAPNVLLHWNARS